MGSSLAMTIPALFVKANEVEKGQEVSVIFGFDGILVLSKFADHEAIRGPLLSILESIEERVIDEGSDPDED